MNLVYVHKNKHDYIYNNKNSHILLLLLKYKIKSTTIFNKTNRFQFQNSIVADYLY